MPSDLPWVVARRSFGFRKIYFWWFTYATVALEIIEPLSNDVLFIVLLLFIRFTTDIKFLNKRFSSILK
jgi:hypothetical protein